MLVKEELGREAPIKAGSNYKGYYKDKEKRLIVPRKCKWITYTQALEWLLAKGKINLPRVNPETEFLKQFKFFIWQSTVNIIGLKGIILKTIRLLIID